jgi:uncharacterized protein YndB with AHSA1/START domain
MIGRLLAAAALSALAAMPTEAQVGPNGFMLRLEATLAAPRARVYEALVQPGSWWNGEHTYSGDARNLSIDPRPGGCWCERLPGGGGVEHGRVIYVVPGETLRVSGGHGPLQEWGATGSMTWALVEASGTTTVRLSYGVGGFFAGGFERIAPAVEQVLAEQLARLKGFVETGNAETDPDPEGA